MKILRTINLSILICILLLINLLPLISVPFLINAFEFPRFIVFGFISSILVLLNGVNIFLQKKVELPSKIITVSIIFYITVYLISTLFSTSFFISFLGVREIYTGGFLYQLLLIIVFYSAFVVRKYKEIILKSICLSATAVSLYGIYQYGLNYYHNKDLFFRIFSTIGQPAKLSFYLLPAIPISYYLYSNRKKILSKLLYGLCFFSIAIAFFLTFTRTSYFVLLILLIIFLMKVKNQYLKNLRVKFVSIFFVILLLFFGYIVIRSLPYKYIDYKNSSLYLRMEEWKSAVLNLKNRILIRQLIGYGPDTASFFYSKSKLTDSVYLFEEKYSPSLQIRNHYLNIFSTIGILGSISYLYLVFFILKLFFTNKENSTFAIFFSLLAIIIHSLFYFQTDNILIIFWVMLGLTFNKSFFIRINKIYLNKTILFTMIFITSLLLFIFFRITLAELYISLNFSTKSLISAIKQNPYSDYYPRQLALLYFQNSLDSIDIDKQAAEKNIVKANSSLTTAYSLSNYNYENVVLLSRINYWAGTKIDKKYQYIALYWAKKVINLDPTNYINWDQLGLIYLDLGKLDDALNSFNKEKVLDPNAPVIYLHIGEVLKQKGQLNKAMEQYNKALLLNPDYDLAKSEIQKIRNLIKPE